MSRGRDHARRAMLLPLMCSLLLPLVMLATCMATAPQDQPAPASVAHLLDRIAFRNSGTTRKSDRYTWELIEPTGNQHFYYLEPQNVTTVHGLWGIWGETTKANSGRHYKFLLPPGPPPAPATCKTLSTTPNHDIPGHDAGEVQHRSDGSYVRAPADCEELCCASAPGCDGFVYTPTTPVVMGGCANASQPCCYLKAGAVGAPQIPCAPGGNKSYTGCIAVTLQTSRDAAAHYTGTAPPSGIRSAVPLGGISCGSVELRGDGSFSEWTIMNQSPAGAAKVAAYPDALFALRLCGSGGCAARLLQTHPIGDAAACAAAGDCPLAIDALTYSGSHPVSRLQPVDAGLRAAAPQINATLFAYSSLVAANMTASARPAAAFTLLLRNTGETAGNATFMLNMPLQIETDQIRPGGTPIGNASNTANSSVCAAACHSTPACVSWNFERSTNSCQLQQTGPLNRYMEGFDSGVKGSWSSDPDGRCIVLRRPGAMPFSGEVALCAASPSSAAVEQSVQLRPHSDVAGLLRDFSRAADLALLPDSGQQQHGAIQVSATVGARVTTAITITMGWRFPHLDWFSYDCKGANNCYTAIADKPNNAWEYGNQYAEIWSSARQAAFDSADETALQQTLVDIHAVHSIFMDSTLPDWLQDHLVNSISHARDSYWFRDCPACSGQGCGVQPCVRSKDPRVSGILWRQFEANDCPDLGAAQSRMQSSPTVPCHLHSALHECLCWTNPFE